MAAAAPSVAYQAKVISRFDDNHGRKVLLRRGYYDSVLDEGFGYDKTVNKHNLTDAEIIVAVVGNPESSGLEDAGADRWWYRGPWQRRECTSDRRCKVIDQVWVRVIVEFQTWQSSPGQGEIGVITGYCEGMTRCPDWLNRLVAR